MVYFVLFLFVLLISGLKLSLLAYKLTDIFNVTVIVIMITIPLFVIVIIILFYFFVIVIIKTDLTITLESFNPTIKILTWQNRNYKKTMPKWK